MPCKNCMAADKQDKHYESPESTHSYCNTEKKGKKKSPKAAFGSCVVIFLRRLGKELICPVVSMGERTPGADAGAGVTAEGCLPSPPCAQALPAETWLWLHSSTGHSSTGRPEPPGRTAEAGRNIPRKGRSFADSPFHVTKLQARSPGVRG